jgi:hypothetical protein
VISADDMKFAIKSFNQSLISSEDLSIATAKGAVAKDIYIIVRPHKCVMALDDCFIHLLDT